MEAEVNVRSVCVCVWGGGGSKVVFLLPMSIISMLLFLESRVLKTQPMVVASLKAQLKRSCNCIPNNSNDYARPLPVELVIGASTRGARGYVGVR